MKRTASTLRGDEGASASARPARRAPGMDLAHDVLVAVTMGIALALLGTTTWVWALAR